MKIPAKWYWCRKKHHFVGLIQDDDNHLVVSKVWSRSRQGWQYFTERRDMVERQIKDWPQDQRSQQ